MVATSSFFGPDWRREIRSVVASLSRAQPHGRYRGGCVPDRHVVATIQMDLSVYSVVREALVNLGAIEVVRGRFGNEDCLSLTGRGEALLLGAHERKRRSR